MCGKKEDEEPERDFPTWVDTTDHIYPIMGPREARVAMVEIQQQPSPAR